MDTLKILLATATLLIASCSSQSGTPIPTPDMLGTWNGEAQIIVSWAQQKTLPVTLEIHPDAAVTGTVGDATLSNARLQQNRGPLGRHLNLATDYIITGDLTGPVVAAEHITRGKINFPLNFHAHTFTGGLHTSGTKSADQHTGVLSATSLQLTQKKPAAHP